VKDDFNLLVVNTFAKDEPLEEILAAAGELEEVQFYITGKADRGAKRIPTNLPSNVHFTDFLPDQAYYGLMKESQAVMCLTTRDHTMQRGACEALSLGKPIITSQWPLLRNYFHQGTVHVDNTADGIRTGIEEMKRNIPKYQEGIKRLQREQQLEWRKKIKKLETLIEQALTKGSINRESEEI
jgi:glycosyltransferase involved in cell wall biosynthesis